MQHLACFNQALDPDVGYRSQNEVAQASPATKVQPAAIGNFSAASASSDSPRTYANAAFAAGHEGTDRVLVYESQSGGRVFAFLVEHEPVKPAFGYRIEYKGRVVVISSDTLSRITELFHARALDLPLNLNGACS